MLAETLDLSVEHGIREAVIGMAHRGRLNVLTHILSLSYETLLAEFEGGRRVEETLTPKGGTGDVKYHHGASGTYANPSGGKLAVTMMPTQRWPSCCTGTRPSRHKVSWRRRSISRGWTGTAPAGRCTSFSTTRW